MKFVARKIAKHEIENENSQKKPGQTKMYMIRLPSRSAEATQSVDLSHFGLFKMLFQFYFSTYRSSCVKTGGPLCFLISSSVCTPTINLSPSAFA